jgi:hypothetical protein
MRSLRDSRSEPYTVDQQHLRGWTLALEPASTPNQPLLVLRPAAALPQDLFRQVFAANDGVLHRAGGLGHADRPAR